MQFRITFPPGHEHEDDTIEVDGRSYLIRYPGMAEEIWQSYYLSSPYLSHRDTASEVLQFLDIDGPFSVEDA